MAKVSICIPTYNNAPEVERLLKSIYEQDYTDFEVNISDDSTNEEIAELIGKIKAGTWQDTPYEQKTKKHVEAALRYVHNEKPLGHIYNWNAAIKMARGEYIKIMFSDDWFTNRTCLGDFAALLDSKPQAMLAFCGSRQVMLDGGQAAGVKHVDEAHRKDWYDRCASKAFIQQLEQDYRTLFLGNQIGAPSATIYRRGNHLALFDEKSNWASDMFLFFELLQESPIFAYTTKPLVCIGVHKHQYTESFSERDMRIYNDYCYMYKKYHLQESEVCRAYFTEQFIIKYHKSMKEAKVLGIDRSMYWKKWFAEQRETIRCFINARMQCKNA